MAACLLSISAAQASTELSAEAAFSRELGLFVDQLRATPHAPPGFVVVAFHEGETVFERAYGTRNDRTGAPMTLDTPIYNASLTKAYTGLLAALLHEDGKLPADTAITSVWPGLTLPVPVDPDQVTAAKLLSHSSGIFDPGLQFRFNVTGQVSPAAIPKHLATHAEARPGFQYTNFGPFLYSAMVEARTGLTWHQAMKRRVLDPLGLAATYTQLEGRPAAEAARCHVVRGGKLSPVPSKPNAVLNAAGGMYASARDTARFLKLFTTDGRSARGRISPGAIRHSWQQQSVQDRSIAGLKRDGHGLGWDLGPYDGHRYVSRSGSYYGCGSYALWLPEERFGVAVLSIGDVAVTTMNVMILMQAVDLWTEHPEASRRARERVASFHKLAATEAQKHQSPDPKLTHPAPLDRRTAARSVGAYDNARLGQAVIALDGDKLVLRAGVLEGELVPVTRNEFLFVDSASLEASPFTLIGDGAQGYEAFIMFGDDRYDRVR